MIAIICLGTDAQKLLVLCKTKRNGRTQTKYVLIIDVWSKNTSKWTVCGRRNTAKWRNRLASCWCPEIEPDRYRIVIGPFEVSRIDAYDQNSKRRRHQGDLHPIPIPGFRSIIDRRDLEDASPVPPSARICPSNDCASQNQLRLGSKKNNNNKAALIPSPLQNVPRQRRSSIFFFWLTKKNTIKQSKMRHAKANGRSFLLRSTSLCFYITLARFFKAWKSRSFRVRAAKLVEKKINKKTPSVSLLAPRKKMNSLSKSRFFYKSVFRRYFLLKRNPSIFHRFFFEWVF